jgi:hypothetical protein
MEFCIHREDIVVPFNGAIRSKDYTFIELAKSEVVGPNLRAAEGRK